MSRRTLVALLVAGALARIVVMPLPGTPDVSALKVWSYGAVQDFSGVYGAGGTPLERRDIHWHDDTGTVTYPPMSLAELAAVGHIYRAMRPDYPDSVLLTVLIKLTGLVSEIALVVFLLTWGRRAMGAPRRIGPASGDTTKHPRLVRARDGLSDVADVRPLLVGAGGDPCVRRLERPDVPRPGDARACRARFGEGAPP
jgi:hypothetical protein